MEDVRSRLRLEFIKKDEYKKVIKQQSKLTFNGLYKSYENCDVYTFRQNEVVMDKAVYVGLAILELSKLHMYEIFYDKIQPCFGQKKLQLNYIDTDGMILSRKTQKIIKDLKILKDVFDFGDLNENHEIFSNKNRKVIGKFEIETPKNIWVEEIICLRSKVYSFKCKDDDENRSNLKGVSKSQSKHIKFEEYKKCLNGEEYQRECDKLFSKSISDDMYLQKIRK